jgi:gamma-glutamyltranspeptidase/glutathione hydrolase
MKHQRATTVFLGLAALACTSAGVACAADPPWLARSRTGMVASDSPEASRIGAGVLLAGGNAFDAAVATSFALAVARPQSTGLGGGGFMLAWVAAEKRFVALDFRECAPKAATPELYARLADQKGDGPSPSVYGGNAIGVPGQLAGLVEINRRFGTQPLKELIRPAATLAEFGFAVDAHYRDSCQEALADLRKWPALALRYRVLFETLLNKGKPPKIAERIKRPDFAKALRLIALEGPQVFYEGPIGEAIVSAANAAGGKLTLADLRSYRVIERQPLRAMLGDYELVTMPPPSSGGVCLTETLNILECLASDAGGVSGLRNHDPNLYPAALVHSFQHAFADRARWLGDPDFTHLPVQRLIDKAYACELARKLGHSPEDFGCTQMPDDHGTSHFCVADHLGNVVALTETINGIFGSLVVAEPYGILLNNQMDDFLTVRGQANLYGLQQSEANLVGPGKRPLSSMCPTIVLQEGRPVLALGGSGGPRIITGVAQVLLNVMEFGEPLDQAVQTVRLHHQWQPDVVFFDVDPSADLRAAIEHARGAGLKISDERRGAVVQAIQFLPDGTLVGASDPRRNGRPAGVP